MPLARGRGSLKKADEGGEWGEKGRVKEGLNRLPCGLWREIYLDKGGGAFGTFGGRWIPFQIEGLLANRDKGKRGSKR